MSTSTTSTLMLAHVTQIQHGVFLANILFGICNVFAPGADTVIYHALSAVRRNRKTSPCQYWFLVQRQRQKRTFHPGARYTPVSLLHFAGKSTGLNLAREGRTAARQCQTAAEEAGRAAKRGENERRRWAGNPHDLRESRIQIGAATRSR